MKTTYTKSFLNNLLIFIIFFLCEPLSASVENLHYREMETHKIQEIINHIDVVFYAFLKNEESAQIKNIKEKLTYYRVEANNRILYQKELDSYLSLNDKSLEIVGLISDFLKNNKTYHEGEYSRSLLIDLNQKIFELIRMENNRLKNSLKENKFADINSKESEENKINSAPDLWSVFMDIKTIFAAIAAIAAAAVGATVWLINIHTKISHANLCMKEMENKISFMGKETKEMFDQKIREVDEKIYSFDKLISRKERYLEQNIFLKSIENSVSLSLVSYRAFEMGMANVIDQSSNGSSEEKDKNNNFLSLHEPDNKSILQIILNLNRDNKIEYFRCLSQLDLSINIAEEAYKKINAVDRWFSKKNESNKNILLSNLLCHLAYYYIDRYRFVAESGLVSEYKDRAFFYYTKSIGFVGAEGEKGGHKWHCLKESQLHVYYHYYKEQLSIDKQKKEIFLKDVCNMLNCESASLDIEWSNKYTKKWDTLISHLTNN